MSIVPYYSFGGWGVHQSGHPLGPALQLQAEGIRLGLPPKTHSKGQGHVTDDAACMLHYTAQAPNNMHARTEHVYISHPGITCGDTHVTSSCAYTGPVPDKG